MTCVFLRTSLLQSWSIVRTPSSTLEAYLLDNFLLLTEWEAYSKGKRPTCSICVYDLCTDELLPGESSPLAVYQLPRGRKIVSFEMVGVQITSHGLRQRAFTPTMTIFRLCIGHTIYVPSSVFLSVTMGRQRQSGPRVVPWKDWGFRTMDVTSSRHFLGRCLGVCGQRVIHDNLILDFNQYDIRNDIYGPSSKRGTVLGMLDTSVGSEASAVASTVFDTAGSYYSSDPSEQPVLTNRSPSYRLTPHDFRRLEATGMTELFFIEERGRPVVRRIVCPRGMRTSP